MLEKLSHKTGFTNDEIKVILFLILVFVTAIGFNYFAGNKANTSHKTFNYAKEDSLFTAASIADNEEEDSLTSEKNEVLDLNSKKELTFTAKKEPAVKSVNLNTAGIKQLVMLPGIGEKTADLILQYRAKLGKFSSIEQLDNVKGIGAKKLEKIRPYIVIN